LKRKFRLILLAVPVSIFLIGIFPFIFRWAGNETIETVRQQMLLYNKSGRIRSSDETQLAISLWKWVAQNLRNPAPGVTVPDTGWVHILASGTGSCDQQAMILIRLARSYNLDARLIFLYGADSVSRHSVAEIWAGGQWCMFDPFYGVVIIDNSGRPYGIDALINEPWRLTAGKRKTIALHAIQDEAAYRRLFKKDYPYVVFSDNKISNEAVFWMKALQLYSRIPCEFYNRILWPES
jgi:hypothetical protein